MSEKLHHKAVGPGGEDLTIIERSAAGVGALRTSTAGNRLEEQKTESNAVDGVLSFAKPVVGIEIFNRDELNTGLFIVNGVSIRVPPAMTFYAVMGGIPSSNITVMGATSYIVSRYE